MGALLVFRVELFLISFSCHGSREMAQRLSSVSSTHMVAYNIYNSSDRRSNTYF